MRWTLLALALVAACDDTGNVEGARGPCAEGGQLLDDPSCFSVETAEDACWKLVECGAIVVEFPEDEGAWDWDRCLAEIEGRYSEDEEIAIACIRTASCDQLRTTGPYEAPDCLEYP